MASVYIYALIDPESNEIRYVGKSINPKVRLRAHLSPHSLIPKTHKNHWLKLLLSRGLRPLIRILEETTEDLWPERECALIQFYREQGCPLTNTADGGEES